MTASFTLSYNGTTFAPGANVRLSGGGHYVMDLSGSASPSLAGTTYAWQNVGGTGSLDSSSGQQTTWSVNCQGSNTQLQLSIQLTVSAPGGRAGNVTHSWPLVVNQCGS